MNLYRPTTSPAPRSWRKLRPWRRHSLVLVIAGIVYTCIGLVYLIVPLTDDRASGLRAALKHMPVDAWGVVWVAVGLCALLSARWPPQSEKWGYTLLAGLSALWAAFYLLGALFMGAGGSNLTGALVWGLMAVLWWAISGLLNPEDMPLAGD